MNKPTLLRQDDCDGSRSKHHSLSPFLPWFPSRSLVIEFTLLMHQRRRSTLFSLRWMLCVVLHSCICNVISMTDSRSSFKPPAHLFVQFIQIGPLNYFHMFSLHWKRCWDGQFKTAIPSAQQPAVFAKGHFCSLVAGGRHSPRADGRVRRRTCPYCMDTATYLRVGNRIKGRKHLLKEICCVILTIETETSSWQISHCTIGPASRNNPSVFHGLLSLTSSYFRV